MPRLYVLPPSHFCERARWGLDQMGVAYVEEPWAVGVHVLLARRLAPATTLPILDVGTEIIQGSDRILDWTGIKGGNPDLEERFENRIGVLVRQFMYAATLADYRSGARDALLAGVSARQGIIARLAWPITQRLMISGMNAREALVPELERQLAAELDWFEAELGQRQHLVGDDLGRADITAASLLAPLARPAACPLFRRIILPPRVETTLNLWSMRSSLRWVGRVYAKHRRSFPLNRRV